MGLLEKIKEIEAEMARTQKNKATEYHLGNLKAKLAKYRSQLLEPSSKGGDKGNKFIVISPKNSPFFTHPTPPSIHPLGSSYSPL